MQKEMNHPVMKTFKHTVQQARYHLANSKKFRAQGSLPNQNFLIGHSQYQAEWFLQEEMVLYPVSWVLQDFLAPNQLYHHLQQPAQESLYLTLDMNIVWRIH